ncbi:MAG: threonine/serine exporter family protein, partial [Acidobacteriota bacterium]
MIAPTSFPIPIHDTPDHTGVRTATAIALVEKLGRALHAYGSSAHRLENALDLVSRRLGLRGHFFSTPTAIFASFEPTDEGSDEAPRTVLLRVQPGDVDLERLTALDAVLGRVMHGEQEPADAVREVDEIIASPPRYGPLITFLAFALASGGAARFFGGGLPEVLAATGIGLVTGLLSWVAERLPNAGRLYETFAAMATALLATAAASQVPLAFPVVTVSALIVLVPGLTLTVAMTE